MLIAAHSPSVALRTQPQSVSGQRIQRDAYPAPVAPLSVSVPISAPASAPVSIPVSVQVQVPSPAPAPVQQVVEEPVVVPVHERLLAAQLAHLASQHHASEYNRFKFGQRGSPVAYVPLSLQAPGHIRQLRTRQAANSEHRVWWLSEQAGSISREKSARLEAQADLEMQTLPTMLTASSSDIQQEISAAISAQIPSAHITKTSQSHPINISMVIPYEVLPAIASKLLPSMSSPVMFNLPESCYLDRVTTVPTHGAQTFSPYYRSGNPLFLPPIRPRVSITWAQQGSSDLLQNALDGDFAFSAPRSLFVPSQERRGTRPPTELPTPPFGLQSRAPTPPSPPKGVIRRHPRRGRALSAPPAFQILKGMQRITPTLKELRQGLSRNRSNPEVPITRLEIPPSVVPSALVALESAVADTNNQEGDLMTGANGRGLVLPPASVVPSPAAQHTPMPAFVGSGLEDPVPLQLLGNLYLSSCPGKKVRLSGPVKGRSAICRDLRADLSRVKELGVGCIICCLDDTELDFLGASWLEYSTVANELGLDVLRIPMPEGLAPLSPASLDAHLKRIIETYTLRSVPVLAHCRGGVGRAGLVACCWMLKLGLCGWKDPDVCARSCSEHAHCSEVAGLASRRGMTQPRIQTQTQTPVQIQIRTQNRPQGSVTTLANVPRVCRATVQLVERALTVMRRRRSLKAVETFEQVRFLVDFVEYLDAEARTSGPSLP